MLLIRAEEPTDAAGICRIHETAFPTHAEACLVAALRDAGRLSVSLVAASCKEILGHVAFSPVQLTGSEWKRGFGLAPVAVLPRHQRKGIGSRLVREGLAACRRKGVGFVVVLGDPAWYRRFGFCRASDHGLSNEYGAVEEFMVLAFAPASLPSRGALIRYAPEFAALS
jgi:putative acetyltransferase